MSKPNTGNLTPAPGCWPLVNHGETDTGRSTLATLWAAAAALLEIANAYAASRLAAQQM